MTGTATPDPSVTGSAAAGIPFDPNEFFAGMWDFFGSAIIPAAAALVGIWIGANLAARAEQRKAITDLRQSAYLDSIALVYRLRNDIRSFARNAGQGVKDKQADEEAAAAIMDAFAANDELDALDARVAVVGSAVVRDGIHAYRMATQSYFDTLREQLRTGRASAEAAIAYQADFDRITENYLATLRKGMDVDDLVKSRTRPRTARKTVPPSGA
jgi:hypothetical protein